MLESVEAKKELEHARGRLHDSFDTLLRSAMGGTYAHSDEEGFSGSDFTSKLEINGTKADVRINPAERYEEILYKGFAFKVTPLLVTLEAKVRYGLQKGGEKHRKDIHEMIIRNYETS